jgi:hypothetical protein
VEIRRGDLREEGVEILYRHGLGDETALLDAEVND